MISPIAFGNMIKKSSNFGHFVRTPKPEDYDSLQDFRRMRNLTGLSCASCGETMYPEKEIQSYRYTIANAADKTLADALSSAIPYMNPAAKAVAKRIIPLTEKHEAADIRDLMHILIKSRKLQFAEKQNKKLEAKLKKYMKPEVLYSLPRSVSETLTQSYDLSAKKKHDFQRLRENRGLGFVRDNVLQKLQFAIAEHPEYKGILSLIRRDVQKLDSHFNSPDAFIMRCEKMDNAEIADLFFDARRPTVEHIVTRLDGGKNNPGNLLLFCKECNVDRDRTDYRDMPYSQPNFVPNLKGFISQVKERVSNGELTGFEKYPKQVAETLYKVSDGNIDIEV